MAEGLFLLTTVGTYLGRGCIEPGGVGGEVALLGPYLMNTALHEFARAHQEVRREGKGEPIVGGSCQEGEAVFIH